MKISIKIKGGDKIVNGLKRFERSFLSNATKAGKETNKNFKQFLQDTMNDGGWQPNAENYLSWKSWSGYSTRPLFRTSLLHNSIAHELKWGKDSLRGQIGWHEGARYPGELKGKVWKGRVPNKRKKKLEPPSGMYGNPQSSTDTNYLAQVAEWNEKGTEGAVGTVKVPVSVRNGFRKNKRGDATQKWRTKYYNKQVYTSPGRPPRPFVARTFNEHKDLPFILFSLAMDKTVASMFGRAGRAKAPSSPIADSVPF